MQHFTTPEGVHIMLMSLGESIEEILLQLPDSENYKTQLAQIKCEQRRWEFLGVRWLLFQAFGAHDMLQHDENGKPFLRGINRNISISHTKGYVCISWHDTLCSGVDIECLGKRVERVQTRFLSANELATLHDDEKHTKAHLYWSAKESVFKLIGKKAVDFRQHIEIEPFELDTQGTFFAFVLPEMQKTIVHYWCTESYVMTVATINTN